MTPLYRLAEAENPELGHSTLWTTDPELAEWLAACEGIDAAGSRLYRADVDLSMDAWFAVEQFIREGRMDISAAVSHAKGSAPRGCEWLQFRDYGRPWKGAMLYLGDERVPARPTGRSED